MAIFRPGPAAAQISGSIGGTTFSHNRGGQYMRLRSIPTKVTSVPAQNAKNRITQLSREWGSLAADNQTAWKVWAQENPIINAVGDKITLAGHMAYMQINNNLLQAGDTILDLPPVDPAPDPLLTLSAVADESDHSFTITFTATPLGAGLRLMSEVAIVASPGINYVENLYRLVDISAAAQATGLDIGSDVEDRFGPLTENARFFLRCRVLDGATGLSSGPLLATGAVQA